MSPLITISPRRLPHRVGVEARAKGNGMTDDVEEPDGDTLEPVGLEDDDDLLGLEDIDAKDDGDDDDFDDD
jgi:hypothetical protein